MVGVGTCHPDAYAWAVISTTLAPRITKAQKMNEWRTPAYHSRATLRWKMPYTMKFLSRVGTWSQRRSFAFARNRYRIRRYSFRPKIDRETTMKRVAAYVSRALSTMRIVGKAPSLHQPAGRGFSNGRTMPSGSCSWMRRVILASSDSGYISSYASNGTLRTFESGATTTRTISGEC